MDVTKLSALTDSQIRETKTGFKSFAANWNVEPCAPALKMFLACAADMAMHSTGVAEIPDDEWEAFYERVVSA